jgi:voltage-gated potassium channel
MRLSVEAREEALSRFERATAWPLLIMALAIIPIIVLPLVIDLSPAAQTSLTAADWMIWATFAIEYSIRLFLAPRKWPFLKHNVIDTLVVVVPFAQPLRLLRSARVLRLTRVARAGTYMARGAEEGRSLFSRENFSYAIAVTLLALGGASLLVWAVERQAPAANIKTLPDALWWAVTTVSTVGYGDRYPVTAEGRAIALVLMVLGIALFGVIAATLSSFFVEQQHKGEFAKLMEKIESLERRLEDIQGASSTTRRRALDEPRPDPPGSTT